MVGKVYMHHLQAVRQHQSSSDDHWEMVRKAHLVDAVEKLRQGNVWVGDLGKLLSDIRTTLRHAHNPLYGFMSSFTSLEEINHLENKMNVKFVKDGIASLKQKGSWPFLPGIAKREIDQKVQEAVLKKVRSVLPLLPKGWPALDTTEDELRRCVNLAPYLRKRYVISKTLFDVVETSKLYPDVTQTELERQFAPSIAMSNANELRYRVSQGEFTFAELYTTETQLEQTLRHINKALSKLAP